MFFTSCEQNNRQVPCEGGGEGQTGESLRIADTTGRYHAREEGVQAGDDETGRSRWHREGGGVQTHDEGRGEPRQSRRRASLVAARRVHGTIAEA